MTGLRFPLAIDGYGAFAVDVTDDDMWESRAAMTLATMVGERIGRPDFGVNLRLLLWSGTDKESLDLMAQEITSVFSRDLPQLTLQEVSFDESELITGKLNIIIRWALPSGLEQVDSLSVSIDQSE